MTEQAILDLPLIEFEQFGDSTEALRRHCAQTYGLVGLPPHPDTAFHFAASLWRCRDNESNFQIAALAAFYLRALSHFAAAERRLAAAKETARELKGEDADETVSNADENLRYAREDAEALGRLILQIASSLDHAGRKLDANLRVLADDRWQRETSQMIGPLLSANPDLIDWSLPLQDVLDELARERAVLLRTSSAASRSGRLGALLAPASAQPALTGDAVLETARREIDAARQQAAQTAERAEQAERSRLELDDLLRRTEQAFDEQSSLLEEAKNALEMTLGEVRRRLERAENAPAEDLGPELDALRRERDALSEELTRALDRAAEADSRREDLVASHDARDAEAAVTIESLKAKVESQTVMIRQGETRLAELNQTLDGLRRELVASEQRHTAAKASLDALEAESQALRTEADRYAQAEQLLTESENRLAEAQQRAVEADLRVQQIEGVVAEKDVKLAQFDRVLREQKSQLEALGAKLAAAEKAAADSRKQSTELERQLTEARKALSDESGRLRQINERERKIIEESGKLQASLEESRQTSVRLKASLEQRERELGDLRTEVREKSTLRDRTESEAKNLRYDYEKLEREHAELARAADEYRRRVTENELRLMDVEQRLLSSEEDAQAARARASDVEGKLQGDLGLLRERLKNADAEKQILLDALSRSEENRRAEKAELEKQMEVLRAESAERHQTLLKLQAEGDKTRKRLDESDAFLIARQREMDRVNNKLRYVLGEISAVADLRARIENTRDESEIQKFGSEVAKRLDNLFAEAGSPIHADRRTEKILILHLKKTADEQAKDAPKPVLAIGENARDASDEEDPAAKTSLGLDVPEKKPRKGK